MGKIAKSKTDDLGVKVTGSARTGHKIELSQDGALCRIFGTSDETQAKALMSHCLKPLGADEASDEHPGNDERAFMLSIVNDMAPRDPVERMLAVQMAATHVATIRAGGWLSRAENLAQGQAHSTAYAKLARTFAAQVEALRRHRTGGEQRVIVQHVNVADGGQAIVGNVQHGGEGRR
ncbi:MAG: hypothetical protein O2985_17670 [Proteobacteria bacterium]|nr:hypothetical protein [Pseudomonadota bacterium]